MTSNDPVTFWGYKLCHVAGLLLLFIKVFFSLITKISPVNFVTRTFTLVYLKAVATVQGSGYSFKKTWLQLKMADLPESSKTNAHFTEVTLSMPI